MVSLVGMWANWLSKLLEFSKFTVRGRRAHMDEKEVGYKGRKREMEGRDGNRLHQKGNQFCN